MSDPVHPDHEASLRINQGPCTARHSGVCREHWFSCGHLSHSLIIGDKRHTSVSRFALEKAYEDARCHLKASY